MTASQSFVPREHGATAMLLTPFLAAVILLRRFYWLEIAALLAILCAFGIKDPLVVIARQRFVWRQRHPETTVAARSFLIESLLLAICGAALLVVRDWRPFIPLFLGAAAFTALAVFLTVRNRQRSEWFQVASAAALSATSLTACLAGNGSIPAWCWLLWLLCALQAAAGIFVVHARLDALIAARKHQAVSGRNRRAAWLCQSMLILAGFIFARYARYWIAGALFLAAIVYSIDLWLQNKPESLQKPLKRVGLEALGLSIAYSLLVIAGLWHG
jgi:YwiC-like protein